MIWMAVAGSVNVKVAVKVVRDKAGLHQIRGEQLRGDQGDILIAPDITHRKMYPDLNRYCF